MTEMANKALRIQFRRYDGDCDRRIASLQSEMRDIPNCQHLLQQCEN